MNLVWNFRKCWTAFSYLDCNMSGIAGEMMIGFRAKLLLFLALIIMVVIAAWIYAQRTYSAFNLVDSGGQGLSGTQNIGIGSATLTSNPAPGLTTTLVPAAITATPGDVGCTLPLEYWLQNQTKIPPQIPVNFSAANQTEACVIYAESEICAVLEEVSTAPDVILRQQFLVAIMNYLSGADTGSVGNTINEAYEWLRSHLAAESVSAEDAQVAQGYITDLRAFNQGDIGPGACDVEIITVVRTAGIPSTPTASSAPAAFSPTVTTTPTVRRTVIVTVPVSTDAPPQEPEATNTPVPPPNTEPAPSDTPPPPPPPPTNTEIPPATPTEFPTPTPVPDDATPTPVP
jgi:hypothetical protein